MAKFTFTNGHTVEIPDEGVLYKDESGQNVHVRQGGTLYAIRANLLSGVDMASLPTYVHTGETSQALAQLGGTGGGTQVTDPSIFKSVKPIVGEEITRSISPNNPQGADTVSNIPGSPNNVTTPTIQENLMNIKPEEGRAATPEQAKILADAQAGGVPVSPEAAAAGGVFPAPSPTPTPSPMLTPAQQTEYFKTEGAKPNPLSPADWLRQQSSGGTTTPSSAVPETAQTPAEAAKAITTLPAEGRILTDEEIAALRRQQGLPATPVSAPAPTAAPSPTSPGAAPSTTGTEGGLPEPQRQAEIVKMDADINAWMEKAAKTISEETTPAVRESSKLLGKLEDLFTGAGAEKPATVSLKQTFEDQRAKLGVGEMETNLSNIDSKLAKLDADYASSSEKEEGRTVSMTQIGRRQSALGQEYNRQRRDLVAERESVARTLDVKYGIINTMVNLTGKDYGTATDNYNTRFSQAITLLNAFKGIEDSQKLDIERKQDNARANVQIMVNLLKDGNVMASSLSDATRLEIRKAETAAGFPTGFVEAVTKATGKTEVQFLPSYTDEGGNRIQPIATKDSKGAYTLSNVTLGRAQTTEQKDADKKKADYAAARQFIQVNPKMTDEAMQVSLRERTNLSDGDITALLKDRAIQTPATAEAVKTKIISVLTPLKTSLSRKEARDLAEAELLKSMKIDKLPKAYADAIDAGIVQVYGRSGLQRAAVGVYNALSGGKKLAPGATAGTK